MMFEDGIVVMSKSDYEAFQNIRRKYDELQEALIKVTRETEAEDIDLPMEVFLDVYNKAMKKTSDAYDNENGNPIEDDDIYGYFVTIHWHGLQCNCHDGEVAHSNITKAIKGILKETDPEDWK